MSIFSPAELRGDGPDAGAELADRGALGVDARLGRAHGDLRPVAGLPRHRGDLDDAGRDLRHLQREQPAHERRVGAGDGDGRALRRRGRRSSRTRGCARRGGRSRRAPAPRAAGSPRSSPRSTCTMRGFGPCWMTPAMMSPSRPLNSPSTRSSPMSRRRWLMTCFAAKAATRPKSCGSSTASPTCSPSSSSSGTKTVTCPLLRSICDARRRRCRPAGARAGRCASGRR